MAKILQVVPYFLDHPRHGGQIRCSKINEKLKALGHDVTLLTVHASKFNKTHLGPEVYLPDSFRDQLLKEWSQIVPGIALTNYFKGAEGQTQLKSAIQAPDFDYIWVDQHFMIEPMQIFYSSRPNKKKPIFINSTQNIEHQMLYEYLPELPHSNISKNWILEVMKSDEKAAAKLADINVAVTLNDLTVIQSWNPTARVLLLPNGATPLSFLNTEIKETKELNDITNGRKYALFIASGHPPNLHGFSNMIGKNLSFLPPDFLIVCAGSVATPIYHFLAERLEGQLNMSRISLLENVSNSLLENLRSNAWVSLLPITSGGGSNLKTAEALLSPGYVLGTEQSFRGFAERINDPGVFIENNAVSFRAKLASLAIDSTKPNFERKSNKNSPLTWEDTMLPLDEIFGER